MAIVRNYPKEKEFIYNNKIIVKDAASVQNAKELSMALDNYWDDSIKVLKIRQYGIFNTIINQIKFIYYFFYLFIHFNLFFL